MQTIRMSNSIIDQNLANLIQVVIKNRELGGKAAEAAI